MYGHAYMHFRPARPILRTQRTLGVDGRGQGGARSRERSHHRTGFTSIERLNTPMRRDRCGDQLGLPGQKDRGLVRP
jgi:hypothetical protein